MRICFLGRAADVNPLVNPLASRRLLAYQLASEGHDVFFVLAGSTNRTYEDHGVVVREFQLAGVNRYLDRNSNVDACLTASQALYEGLLEIESQCSIDVIDAPLEGCSAFITLQRHMRPTAIWLPSALGRTNHPDTYFHAQNDKAFAALLMQSMVRAGGLFADSQLSLDQAQRLMPLNNRRPLSITLGGLPFWPDRLNSQTQTSDMIVSVVDNLPPTGSGALFRLALLSLMRQFNQLRVHFLALGIPDDGTAMGASQLQQWVRERCPEYINRIEFSSVTDPDQLSAGLRGSCLAVILPNQQTPAAVYACALRDGLPTVTLATGIATEIYPNGELDGGLLLSPEDNNGLAQQVCALLEQPARRAALGGKSSSRFAGSLSTEVMTQTALSLYEQIIKHGRERQPAPKIFQVVDWLDVGDGLSNIARKTAGLLGEIGYRETILARDAHPEVKGETRPLQQAYSQPAAGVLFHYAAYNYSTWLLTAMIGPKALYYHNITPPEYFPKDSDAYRSTVWGHQQLLLTIDMFDLLIGASQYNVRELRRLARRRVPGIHIYPVIEAADLLKAPYDHGLFSELRSSGKTNILFVGRLARNKRQDMLMSLFDRYWREIDTNARLWLVGSELSDPAYRLELEQIRNNLRSGNNIIIVGKIPDRQLWAYYRAASVFVCASEHEGFCIPLAQAMAFGVPVIARACAALPETMGEAGVLVDEWDIPRLCELIWLIIHDQQLRQRIVAGQMANIARFSATEARQRLAAVARFLVEGEAGLLFE